MMSLLSAPSNLSLCYHYCLPLLLPLYYVMIVCKSVFVYRAREALRQCLPDQLKDLTFQNCLKDDTTTKRWLVQLQQNLSENHPDPAANRT